MASRRPTGDEDGLRSSGRKSLLNRSDRGERRSGTDRGDRGDRDGRLSGTAASGTISDGIAGGGGGAYAASAGEPIRVSLRLRPQNELESSKRGKSCVDIHKGSTKVTVDAPLEGEFDFSFDRVFGDRAGQGDVYDGAVAALVQKTMDGLDTSLIAFGETGSGKTHTMMGTGWGNGLGGITGAMEDGVAASNAHDAHTLASTQLTDEKGNKVPVNLSKDAGMIPRIVRDLFKNMAESSYKNEFTVRVSYVEIYMEKVLDLLNPTNRSLSILCDTGGEDEVTGDDELDTSSGGVDLPMGGGVRVRGAAELCCLNEVDALALLARGNAYRKLSSNDMSTDSNRSHSVFMIRLEQRDAEIGNSRTSRMILVDLAGSEMADSSVSKSRVEQQKGNGAPSQKEAKMINRSFDSLIDVIDTLGNQHQTSQSDDGGGANHSSVPYQKSTLTKLLQHAFGGRCSTTIILTGSPSSFSISETIATIRFGQKCRRIKNRPQICFDLSPSEYRKQLAASERRQTELMSFVKALAGECRNLKTEGIRGRLKETAHRGPIWDSIDTILEENEKEEGGLASRLAAIGQRSKFQHNASSSRHSTIAGTASAASSSEINALQEELEKTKAELANAKKDAFKATQARNKAESILGEIQSEAAALRTQNENLSAEKKKNMQDLIDAKNEIQVLSQRKLEVEHNLRVSQFRENEATVFLRQFRRFYRRLLRNKAAQGTGGTSEITAKVPGVPDLNDLIDVDTLLLESGLIEEEELRDDAAVGTYRPSSQALLRSTSAAKKAAKEAAALDKVVGNGSITSAENLGSISESDSAPVVGMGPSGEDDDSITGSVSAQSILSRNSKGRMSALNITAKQQNLQTPSGRLISMREKDLERDLLQMTERCIELQIALNEEKANVDVLTNRTGSLSKKRLAQEAISLRQALDRKTHDLQAIIWKMNELHLINKTYNEKMANREQHVTYLEENLVDLQNTNRKLISERQDAEVRLRSELGEMKILVDSMTIPLWQFGEEGPSQQSLASRVIIPVRGGPYPDGLNWKASPIADSGGGSSNTDTAALDVGGPDSRDTRQNTSNPLLPPKSPPASKGAQASEASAVADNSVSQTILPSSSNTNSLDKTHYKNKPRSLEKATERKDDAKVRDKKRDSQSSKQQSVPARADGDSDNPGASSANTGRNSNGVTDDSEGIDESFVGGRVLEYQQRKFVQKHGKAIRNGVLKESKKKSGESGSVASSSRSKSRTRSSRATTGSRTRRTSRTRGDS